MKRVLAATLLCLATSGAFAQGATANAIASGDPATQTKGKLAVRSASFTTQSLLKPRYSAYSDNVSPALSWTPVRAAKSYAIITEDPDPPTSTATVHWLVWNIPGQVNGLAEGVPQQPHVGSMAGPVQGKNSHGTIGYSGPRPPVGKPPHHYHFQVFALDTSLILPAGASRDQLLAAMKGHVLAKGDLVGQYAQER